MARFTHASIDYHYVDRGVLRGQVPVVLLHGFFASTHAFRHSMAALSEARRVVALDWPGHGESGFAPPGILLDDLESAVLGFLDHLAIERADFVGWSLGGIVALRLVRRSSERVGAIAAVSTPYLPDSDAAKNRHLETLDMAKRIGHEPVLKGIAARMFGATTRRTRPEIVRAWLEESRRVDLASVDALSRAALDRGSPPDLGGRGSSLLIVHGDEDALLPRSDAEALRNAAPGAVLEVVPECGHSVPLENAGALTRELQSFFERI